MKQVASKVVRVEESHAGPVVSSEACGLESDLGVSTTPILTSGEYWAKLPKPRRACTWG